MQACAYDRAGLGWSEASPDPRTSENMVKELHTLLVNSRQIIADQSEHFIQLQQPQLVVEAIKNVVEAIRE